MAVGCHGIDVNLSHCIPTKHQAEWQILSANEASAQPTIHGSQEQTMLRMLILIEKMAKRQSTGAAFVRSPAGSAG